MMRFASSLTGFLFILVLVIGCSEDEPQARRSVGRAPTKRAAVTTGKKAPIPSIFGEIKDTYTYNPVGKRNPFQKYTGESVQEVALPRSPLEMFNLNQLNVTAIVSGISSPRALVLAPNNETFIVRKNMRIGKNRGRVARITRRALYVEEEYRDPTGKLVVRESVLAIRDEKKKDQQKELEIKFQEEG